MRYRKSYFGGTYRVILSFGVELRNDDEVVSQINRPEDLAKENEAHLI